MEVEFKAFGKHFEYDKHERFIFKITLKRGQRQFSFDFGDSLKDAETSFRKIIERNSVYFMTGWAKHFQYPPRVLADEDAVKELKRLLSKNLDKIENPTAYDVLTCLTKNDPGTFKDFCEEFGYDEDSRNAERVYKAVCDEWQNVKTIWTDSEIENLQEIQ